MQLAVVARLEAWTGARRAARFAWAVQHEVARPGQQLLVALMQAGRQAHPAGHAVVEVDDRPLEVRRADLGHQAQVMRVAHQQHAAHRLHGAPGPHERHVQLIAAPAGDGARIEGQPVGGRVHLELGQVDASPAQVLQRGEAQLLVDRGQAADHHFAVGAGGPVGLVAGERLEDLERDGRLGLGEVVHVHGPHVRLPLVPVQAVDVVLARLVEVDGALVDDGRRPEQVDLADDARARPAGIDDHHVVGGGRAQRDLRGGEVLARPVPAPVIGPSHVALLGEEGQQVIRGRAAEALARLEGQLEGGRPHVRQEDVQVVGIQAGLLRRPGQEVGRVARDVLVHRAARGDHDRDRRFLAAAGAAHLLPGRGHRSRVAGQHGRVEPPDVQAELEGVGAHDAQHRRVAQAGFDGPALRGQVAAAVAAQPLARSAALAQRLTQVRQEDLHARARAGEDDRLALGAHEGQGDPLDQAVRAATDAQAGVDHGRVEEDDASRAGRVRRSGR